MCIPSSFPSTFLLRIRVMLIQRTLERITLFIAIFFVSCVNHSVTPEWKVLIDGESGLEHWNSLGGANWRAQDGAIVADKGSSGFLVSKQSYQDFELYAEFWAAADTNSGIFIRASDPRKISASTSYEVNIWDIRPDPSYGTGAIVNFAKVPVPLEHQAGGRWNTMEIVARGTSISVKLNGVLTSSLQNDKFSSGPIALQFGPGVNDVLGGPIKWRKVIIKPL